MYLLIVKFKIIFSKFKVGEERGKKKIPEENIPQMLVADYL